MAKYTGGPKRPEKRPRAGQPNHSMSSSSIRAPVSSFQYFFLGFISQIKKYSFISSPSRRHLYHPLRGGKPLCPPSMSSHLYCPPVLLRDLHAALPGCPSQELRTVLCQLIRVSIMDPIVLGFAHGDQVPGFEGIFRIVFQREDVVNYFRLPEFPEPPG